MTSGRSVLADACIAVTRPQAQRMLSLLHAAGTFPQWVPLIEIVPLMQPAIVARAVRCLAEADAAIFISPTAIEQTLPHMTCWPDDLPVWVIGPGSAECAKQYGLRRIYLPETSFDSEGLLAMPQLQAVAGKRFVIFRGQGGRALLPQTLVQRGANVALIEVYQRVAPVLTALAWQTLQRSDAIILTSSEAVQNLFGQADKNQLDWLKTRTYFVSHPRIGLALQQFGVQRIEQTGVSDQMIVADVVHFFNTRNG